MVPPVIFLGTSEVIRPFDPNNIVGPAGAAADPVPDVIAPGQLRFDGFLRAGANFTYKVEFENQPSASAPAQVVHVTQTVDADLDLATFAFTGFGFGGSRVAVPAGLGGTSFHTVFDATATLGVLVQIDAALNVLTRLLDVTFTSLDPLTNDVPLDPFAGFLPPNDAAGSGDGFITYTVAPKAGLADGTRFDALATIVFDFEPPLDTPQVHNTLDTELPTSQALPLPAVVNPNFLVRWAADDGLGSGAATFDVFVSIDDGPFELWLDDAAVKAAVYTGQPNHKYGFYIQATDHVGFTEVALAVAQTSATTTSSSRWHNLVNALDVTGYGGVVDGVVTANDALAIINYINAFGPGDVPPNPSFGPPYYDTAGGSGNSGDDRVTAQDALAVINFLNAFGSGLPGPAGEGETAAAADAVFGELGIGSSVSTCECETGGPFLGTNSEYLHFLLSTTTVHGKRRRA